MSLLADRDGWKNAHKFPGGDRSGSSRGPSLQAITSEFVGAQLRKSVSPNSSSDFLRIAFCLPEWTPLQEAIRSGEVNAAYIQQEYIATGLQSRGHRLTFIASRSLGEFVCAMDSGDPKSIPLTWSDSWWFNFVRKSAWRIQQWLRLPYLNYFTNYRLLEACLQCLPGHDLVFERTGLYFTGVAMACKRLGLPYVLFFDADQILELDYINRPVTGLLRHRAIAATRHNLAAAKCVICVTEQARAQLITGWKTPAAKILVFPNAADVVRFFPDPQVREAERKSMGIKDSPLIIFVGSFYTWHDVRTLLDAFAQVLATHPDARLVLVGDGDQRQAMMQHSIELGIDHAVRFTGMLPHADVPRLLAAADVAVVPYPPIERELWLSPLKLFEYMASGTAIVASATGQVAEVIVNESNGLLVPPGDISAMAGAMDRLIVHPDLRQKLGQHAREDAVEKYSWDSYVARLEGVLRAVISGQSFDRI